MRTRTTLKLLEISKEKRHVGKIFFFKCLQLALDTWKRLMIEPLKETLLKLILNEVSRDRMGELVNQTVVHGVINSFVNVQEYKRKHPLLLYEELLENPYKLETGAHYRQEAAKLKDEHTCSEYMEKVSEI